MKFHIFLLNVVSSLPTYPSPNIVEHAAEATRNLISSRNSAFTKLSSPMDAPPNLITASNRNTQLGPLSNELSSLPGSSSRIGQVHTSLLPLNQKPSEPKSVDLLTELESSRQSSRLEIKKKLDISAKRKLQRLMKI